MRQLCWRRKQAVADRGALKQQEKGARARAKVPRAIACQRELRRKASQERRARAVASSLHKIRLSSGSVGDDALSRAPAGAALSVQVLRATDFAGPATKTHGRHRSQQGAGVSVASKKAVENSSKNSNVGNCSENSAENVVQNSGENSLEKSPAVSWIVRLENTSSENP